MPKPIGNLVANLTPQDKVSAKTRARYGPKSFNPSSATPQAPSMPTNSAKKPVKYKSRKR